MDNRFESRIQLLTALFDGCSKITGTASPESLKAFEELARKNREEAFAGYKREFAESAARYLKPYDPELHQAANQNVIVEYPDFGGVDYGDLICLIIGNTPVWVSKFKFDVLWKMSETLRNQQIRYFPLEFKDLVISMHIVYQPEAHPTFELDLYVQEQYDIADAAKAFSEIFPEDRVVITAKARHLAVFRNGEMTSRKTLEDFYVGIKPEELKATEF